MTDYDRYQDSGAATGSYDPSLGGYLDRQPPPPEIPDYADGAQGSDPFAYEPPVYAEPPQAETSYDPPSHNEPSYDPPSYEPPSYEPPSYDEPSPEASWDGGADAVLENNHGGMAPGSWGAPVEDEQQWGTHEATAVGEMPLADAGFSSHGGDWNEGEWADTAWDGGEVGDPADRPEPKVRKPLSSSAIFAGFLTIAVLIIGAAAFLAFRVANQTPAGPETPEEAVAALLEAAAAEDVLGMAESLLPSERESLIEPSLALVDELKRIGLLSADTNLNKISGVDVTTADLTMSIEEITEEIRWVTINGGTMSVVGTEGDLPFSDTTEFATEVTNEINFADEPASFAVVAEDGSWYTSVWFTVAETARQASDLPRPALPRQAVGSRSPQDAVGRFVRGAVDMRPSEMLTSMDPVEMRAAYTYSSLYLTDLDSAALEWRRDLRSDGSTWNLASLDTSVQEAGNKALVSIDAFVLTGTDGLSDPFTVSYEDGCLTGDADGVVETICSGDDGFPELSYQVRVVKRDGDWFVSGAPNLIYPFVEYLRTIETDRFDSFEDMFAEMTNVSGLTSAFEGIASTETSGPDVWVRVFSVDQAIPAGTRGEDVIDFIVSDEFPQTLVPSDAIVELSELSGQVVVRDIAAADVLTKAMFAPEDAGEDPGVDPGVDPVDPEQIELPAEPADGSLFPAGSEWHQVPNEESVIFALNSKAENPLWVAERTDGSTVIQITKVRRLGEIRTLNFSRYLGWQKARNIEFDGYASSDYAVVLVEDYLVVSLDPLDDSGLLMEQARYLYQQIR